MVEHSPEERRVTSSNLVLGTMEYVYHRQVDNMRGSVLYPLNELKNIFPEAYEEHKEKYKDREHLLTTSIPILNCLWNDVLHFTPISPNILFKNLSSAGFRAEEIVWKKWFRVPINLLDPKHTIVCIYRRDISYIPRARDFSPFDPLKMNDYKKVLPETIEYYREQKKLGKRPLLFHKVSHILFKGNIETSGLEVIEI